MTAKMQGKIIIDIIMIIMLPILMSYQLIGDNIHEWVGVGMFVMFLLHQILNIRWHQNILKGKYAPSRIMSTLVNLVLFVLMILLMVSGIIMSNYVFSFLNISQGMSWARIVHLAASYWCFVLMCWHLGLHGNMILAVTRKIAHVEGEFTARTVALRVLAGILVIVGIGAFVRRQIPTYLFLQTHFAFFDFNEPIELFFLDYILIIVMIAILGYYARKALNRIKE